MKEKIKAKISSVFNYDRLDVEQLDNVVDEIMIEFNNQRDIVRKETTKEICNKMIGGKTTACDFKLGYNARIEEEKEVKKQILKDLK